MVRALVTGAGGFLGLHLAHKLVARGDSVRSFARGTYAELAALGVEQIQGDLRDAARVAAACEGVDVVFHNASIAGIWGPWKEFYEINTLGTRHVLDGCRRFAVPKLVYTSSPSVTFDGTDQCGVDETAPYPKRWLAHYPHSKALAEQLVLRESGRHGLVACALRPHLIWGPGDHHLIPRLIDRSRKGQLRRVGNGANLIDITFVENAAIAHLQAADALCESAVAGKAYFISQGEPVNCWDWINEVLSLAGLPPVRSSIGFRTAYAAGAMLEGIWKLTGRSDEPRMTRFLAAQLATHHYFDVTAARRDFGYEAKVSTHEGMERLKADLATRGLA